MRKFFLLALFLVTGWVGFWWGQSPVLSKAPVVDVSSPKGYPVTDRKSFVFIVYAQNSAAWCQETLRSLFEQEYDGYRLIFIDDGSIDRTFQIARQFILESHQESKVLLIRNETPLGPSVCLSRAVESLLDREIAIPLQAEDWLTHSGVLTRLNQIYQNPDVWMAFGDALSYPLYQRQERGAATFYAFLLKQLPADPEKGLIALEDLSQGKVLQVAEPLLFSNEASPSKASTRPFSFSRGGAPGSSVP